MSLPLQSAAAMVSSKRQVRIPTATIDELLRVLNSIQAIAYYVEMTLPLSELLSLEYLRNLQELADKGHDILRRLVQDGAAPDNLAREAIGSDPEHDMCVVSGRGCLP